MDGTILQQGSFSATGSNVFIPLVSGVDWMNVYNYTQFSTTTINTGVKFYWQRGMADNDGFVEYHGAATAALWSSTSAALGVGGFSLTPSFDGPAIAGNFPVLGPQVAITAISTANPGVVQCASTAGLAAGSIVLFTNTTGAPQFGGYQFTVVTVTDGTHFTTNAPQLAVAATAGFYQIVAYPAAYYPQNLNINSIITGAVTTVATTIPHGLTLGQEVRFNVPAAFGMPQINGMYGTIVNIPSVLVFQVNINSTGYTAFTFPAAGAVPFTPAQVIPFGIDTGTALSDSVNILADATNNILQRGIILAAGALSPAGQVAGPDLIYWTAGKSVNI